MLKWLRRKQREAAFPPPARISTADIVAAMHLSEQSGQLEPGKALFSMDLDDLSLRIDRDLIGTVRITACQGEDRRFSFSLRCEKKEWENAIDEVIEFLSSDRSLRKLPNSQLVKGHFYGYE